MATPADEGQPEAVLAGPAQPTASVQPAQAEASRAQAVPAEAVPAQGVAARGMAAPGLSSGRSTAMLFVTPMRTGGRLWLSLLARLAAPVPALARLLVQPLVELSVIHFARWSIVTDLPAPAGEPGGRRLRHPYLCFESHFDTETAAYVDTFIEVTPGRMWLVWGSSLGYPGVFPSTGFTDWTEANELNDGYYWCAYPDGTVNMIKAGLALEDRLERFGRDIEGMGAEEFATAWREFLTEVQGWL
jgi:hypothetical protein